jgi:predicted nucleic acid-binding protein
VQLELRESSSHDRARRFLEDGLLARGHRLGVVPHVVEEFIHVSTDPRRFEHPLSMVEALEKADRWWHASEVQQVLTSADSFALFLEWMRGLRLGRRRIHDTLLAATCVTAGITEIVTSDREGFGQFAGLSIVDPLAWEG